MIKSQKLCGLLGLATKAGKLVAGTEACLEAIEKRSIKLVIIAEDAAQRTKKTFHQKCQEIQLPIYESLTIEELSKAIGKTNKAVIGMKEKGFAQAIEKIINGGV